LLDAFIIYSLILIIDTFISYDYAFNGKMEGYGHAEGEKGSREVYLSRYLCLSVCPSIIFIYLSVKIFL